MKAERVRKWEDERSSEDMIEISAVFADRCRWERMGYQDGQPGTAEDVMALMDKKEQDIRFFAKSQNVFQQKLAAVEAMQLQEGLELAEQTLSSAIMPRLSRIYSAVVWHHSVLRFGLIKQSGRDV